MPLSAHFRMSHVSPQSDSSPATNLMELVYDQLRKVAQQRLAEERVGHTLQATALVHEVYLKLSQNRQNPWASRAEFYAAAAEAMRRVLIDHARGRNTQKRGGGRSRAPLSVADLADQQDPLLILALDDAVSRLEKEEPRAATVVRLRFYAGLTVDETAEVMGQSRRTVMRDWEYARVWLRDALDGDL